MKFDVVEGLCWGITGAGEDWRLGGRDFDVRVLIHVDVCIGEDHSAIMIANLTD